MMLKKNRVISIHLMVDVGVITVAVFLVCAIHIRYVSVGEGQVFVIV